MAYEVLFIDLDDTIWDTVTNARESLEEVYRDYHFSRFFPAFDSFYDIYFPNNCKLWKEYALGEITKEELIYERFLFPLRPFGVTDRSYISDLNEDFLERTSQKTKLLPYALEILEYLHPKYRMFILSNGFAEVQHKKINNSGLAPFFEGVILSDVAGYNKPHPQIFKYAVEKAGIRPDQALMIGDNWNTDIAGARNSGIDQVWFDTGIESETDFEPTYRIHCLLQLKDIL